MLASGVVSVMPAGVIEANRTVGLLKGAWTLGHLGRFFGMMTVGSVCTAAGLAAGYWLVPLDHAP